MFARAHSIRDKGGKIDLVTRQSNEIADEDEYYIERDLFCASTQS